jgi:hypothetical protein
VGLWCPLSLADSPLYPGANALRGQRTLQHFSCSHGPVARSCLIDARGTAYRAVATPSASPHSVNAFHELAQAIMRQRFDPMIIAASHGAVIDQRIYDRFFRGLHHAAQERVH